MKGQAWNVWRGTQTSRRHFGSLNGAKKSKDLPLGLREWVVRHCLVFLSQSTGPVRLAVPVNSEKFDSRRPNGKKKLKNPPRPFDQKKKIKTPRPKNNPKKSSRPITNTSNPRFRYWVKFSETYVSRGKILYRLYPFAAIVAFPCRLLALNLPVSYFSSKYLACKWQTWPCNSLLTFLS